MRGLDSNYLVSVSLVFVLCFACKPDESMDSRSSPKDSSEQHRGSRDTQRQPGEDPGTEVTIGGLSLSELEEIYNEPLSVLKIPESGASCSDLRAQVKDFKLENVLQTFNDPRVSCDLLSYTHPAIESNVKLFVSSDTSHQIQALSSLRDPDLEKTPPITRSIAIDVAGQDVFDLVLVSRAKTKWYIRLITAGGSVLNNSVNQSPINHIRSITLYGSSNAEDIIFVTSKNEGALHEMSKSILEPAIEQAIDNENFSIIKKPLADLCLDDASLLRASNHHLNDPNLEMKQLLLAVRRNHGIEKSAEACSRLTRAYAYPNNGLAAPFIDFEDDKNAPTRCNTVLTENRGGFYEQHLTTRNPDCRLAISNPPAFAKTGLTLEQCTLISTPTLCEKGINKVPLPARAHESAQNCREESRKMFDGCLAEGYSEFSKGQKIIDQFGYSQDLPPSYNCLIKIGECPAYPKMENRFVIDSKIVMYRDGYKGVGQICEAREKDLQEFCDQNQKLPADSKAIIPSAPVATAQKNFVTMCEERHARSVDLCIKLAPFRGYNPAICNDLEPLYCFPTRQAASPDFEIRPILADGSLGNTLKDGDVVKIPNFIDIPDDPKNNLKLQDVLHIKDLNPKSSWEITAIMPETFYRLFAKVQNEIIRLSFTDYRKDGRLQFWFARLKTDIERFPNPTDFRIPIILKTNSIKPGKQYISFILEVGNPPPANDFVDNPRDEEKENTEGNLLFDEIIRFDVTGDGCVSSLDSLKVINFMGRNQIPTEPSDAYVFAENSDEARMDVNSDGKISALDALQMINFMGKADANRSRCLDRKS